MMTLWLIFAVMLVLAVIILLWPLAAYKSSQNTPPAVSQKQENIDIFQERLAELENEQAQGNLDESSFILLKTELEKNLLGDVQFADQTMLNKPDQPNSMHWIVMGSIASILVIASLLTYQSLGASEQYAQYLALADEPAPLQQASNKAAPDFAAAVTALKAKLAENPGDIENWFLLANSYMAMGDYPQAAAVYKKMGDIIGEDNPGYASVKAAYAQSLFQQSGEKMTPEIARAINEALRVDPEEPTALILQGLDAYQQESYTQAIAAWEKAKIKGGKSQVERFIEPAIAEARRQMGEAIIPVAEKNQKQIAEAGMARITVKLDMSPAFKAKISPEEPIFVFAKAKMPMPLAAERLQVKDLPVTLILDDTKAAMPTAKLSSVEFVDITARVALSGSPRASKGDLYATVEHVAVHKGAEISLLIDQLVD